MPVSPGEPRRIGHPPAPAPVVPSDYAIPRVDGGFVSSRLHAEPRIVKTPSGGQYDYKDYQDMKSKKKPPKRKMSWKRKKKSSKKDKEEDEISQDYQGKKKIDTFYSKN